jgi:hypothetical protein
MSPAVQSDGKVDHNFSVFRSIDEACEWLGVDSSEIQWPLRSEAEVREGTA